MATNLKSGHNRQCVVVKDSFKTINPITEQWIYFYSVTKKTQQIMTSCEGQRGGDK